MTSSNQRSRMMTSVSAALLLCALVLTPSGISGALPADDSISGNEAADLGPRTYHGHSLIRTRPLQPSHLDLLREIQNSHQDEVEFWRHPVNLDQHVDMRISPEVAGSLLPMLNQSGMQYDVMADDIQRLIEEERPKRSVDDVIPENFTLTQYHTYDEIVQWLEDMVAECGNICELLDIGETFEGRPMKVIRIGKNSGRKPVLWIDAGLHAREWIAPATALYIISKLITGQESDHVSQFLVNRYTWYILPVANPDGYHYTWTTDRLWRKTRSHSPYSRCRGTDPNRNWNFHWGGEGTSNNPCSENYHGLMPFSEAETQNIARMLVSLKERLAVYLSLHSYGQYWLTPWGYTYSLPPDYTDMVNLGTKATKLMKETGSRYQVGSSSRLLYLAAGGSDDWVKGVLGVKYSYTVELRDTGRHGFVLPPSLIETTGEEMMNATRILAVGVLRERRRARRRRRS